MLLIKVDEQTFPEYLVLPISWYRPTVLFYLHRHREPLPSALQLRGLTSIPPGKRLAYRLSSISEKPDRFIRVQVLFHGLNEANTVSYCLSDDLIVWLIMALFAENLVIHLFWVKLVLPKVEGLGSKDQFRSVICLSHIVVQGAECVAF